MLSLLFVVVGCSSIFFVSVGLAVVDGIIGIVIGIVVDAVVLDSYDGFFVVNGHYSDRMIGSYVVSFVYCCRNCKYIRIIAYGCVVRCYLWYSDRSLLMFSSLYHVSFHSSFNAYKLCYSWSFFSIIIVIFYF